jgi:integrase
MGRPRKGPRYLEHKQSGRGRAVFYDRAGSLRDILLPGPFNSEESRAAFGRALLEDHVSPPGAQLARKNPGELLLVELLDAYHSHAESYYRHTDPDRLGQSTSMIYEVRLVIRSLRALYGDTPATEFGPLAMKAVMHSWVSEERSRSEINRRLGVVKRIFKWAASEELIPPTVAVGLSVVRGLERGRTTARDTKPVEPVADSVVDATLPFLNRYVRGMVEFQRLTGCRPGEACLIRRCDIDTGGEVWLYKPAHHKTAHRGRSRVIAIGPKARDVLKEFFTTDRGAYLFPPTAAMGEIRAERSAARATPRFPSHDKRNARKRKKLPRHAPRAKYDHTSYARAVARACDLAFPPPKHLRQKPDETMAAWKARLGKDHWAELQQWRREHRWHPNQLRHSFATKVRKAHGLEAAQVLLGHAKADVTQVYAERDEALAVAIAGQIG